MATRFVVVLPDHDPPTYEEGNIHDKDVEEDASSPIGEDEGDSDKIGHHVHNNMMSISSNVDLENGSIEVSMLVHSDEIGREP
ncbi:hypothetical protein TanjilG_31356 [Lupinus angustifolius]|uniref:Uncharacterized protein n=1 Tax=Lupinus angustifolius TaxID=3871 RepID=A0A1J7HYN7_LUPAN|nr:hypothetical protein TanjilG_31356 [Lupinus angustifolius]